MRIGLLTAIWKRPELTRIVLDYYDNLVVEGVEFVKLAVGSEGADSLILANGNGWGYVEETNDPLGAKWNRGLQAFEDTDVDGVMVIGSDDLISPAYFEQVRDANAEVFSFRGCTMYVQEPRVRLAHSKKFHTGAGRYLSAKLLKRIKYKGWPGGRAYKLDGALDNLVESNTRLGARKWAHNGEGGAWMVDVKTAENMWSFAAMESRLGDFKDDPSPADWWDSNFPGIREQLEQTALTAQNNV